MEDNQQRHHDMNSEEDDKKPPAVSVKKEKENRTSAITVSCSRKRKADDNDNSDDEVEIVAPVSVSTSASAHTSITSNNRNSNDEEVQFLKETGPNPLIDFPHNRQYCLVHPIATSPISFCPQCYCHVCDKLAKDCTTWNDHCHAVSGDPHWDNLRKQQKGKANNGSNNYNSNSVKALLESVTRIYPSEKDPPRDLFQTELKHYQKQSLAFMMHIEQNYTLKAGWLCSEVGMGKTAVILALIVNNPSPHNPTEQEANDSRWNKTILDVKGTIVFTSKSLMGQWHDEILKHAPHLVVRRHYGKEKIKLRELASTDVIISTPTTEFSMVFRKFYRFHRVVLDESHLLGTVSARLQIVTSLHCVSSWCVTATPMVSSVYDLTKQAIFLGLKGELETAQWRDDVRPFLELYMLRHTKSQLIQGQVALALPKSTTEIKQVEMSEWERKTFDEVLSDKGQSVLFRHRLETRMVEMKWYYRLIAPLSCEDSSKIGQLKKDLIVLLEKEPSMRVVVFTQLREQHKFICKALKGMGLKTYRFDGSSSADYRDKAIREFQNVNEEGEGASPAVFVITVQSGSVGITLTAASHVFLMEPCIDPSREYQAAGRINRLGQTKEVGVTKYYFDNTCESKILELHEKIENSAIEYTSGCLSREALDVLRIRNDLCWW